MASPSLDFHNQLRKNVDVNQLSELSDLRKVVKEAFSSCLLMSRC